MVKLTRVECSMRALHIDFLISYGREWISKRTTTINEIIVTENRRISTIFTHVDLTRSWTGHAWLRSTSILESPFPVARVSKRQIDG